MRFLIFTLLFTSLTTGLFASQDKKQLRLRVQGSSGDLDETTLYFDQGVASAFTAQEDAQKVFTTLPGIPQVFSLTSDNQQCQINGFSTLSQTEVIGLGVVVDADGQYTFTAPVLEKFDATSIIRIEDRQQAVFTDLRTDLYTADILATEPTTGRFFLHVSRPATFTNVPAGCINNDGIIQVNQDNSIEWNRCELFDANNQLKGTFTAINGQFDFPNLSEGNYTMVFTYGNYSASKVFHVVSNSIEASISVSTVTAYTLEEIDFHATARNANHFEWDFGDGTQIVGVANPTLAYYEAGTYNVTLKTTNDHGCTQNSNVVVQIAEPLVSGINEQKSIDDISIFSANNNITVKVNNEVTKGAKMQVYNLLGASIYSSPVTQQITTIGFDEQPAGYYIVSVKNNDTTNTRRVYLGAK